MTEPRYQVGQVVYLRESAAIGILEAVTVTGLYNRGNGWSYTIRVGRRPPYSPHVYGNQQSLVTGSLVYFSEDELTTDCDAYSLAEAHALAAYTRIQQLRQSRCP